MAALHQSVFIHTYKRRHLNALHIITPYNKLMQSPRPEIALCVFIFGGQGRSLLLLWPNASSS
jgi:glucan phosphorylase